MRVFGDVLYKRSSSDSQSIEENGAFALGEFDLFMTGLIRNRIEITSELVIEQDIEGNPFIHLEHLEVGYLFTDALKISAGRFHNALGYWNRNFIHGTIFQTTIFRPRFLQFEHDGGILPIHIVGLSASGNYKTGPMRLEYVLMAGNGSPIEPGDHRPYILKPENVSDPNRNKSVTANLTIWPALVPALGIGMSSNHSHVEAFDGSYITSDPIEKVSQQITSAHLVYVGPYRDVSNLEFLSEYYYIRNEDILTDKGSFKNTAFYAQLGYYVTDRWIPYTRYERVRIEDGDPYFELLDVYDFTLWLAGLRFSQNPNSALKAEIQ